MEYARKNNLVIITKDSDFSHKIMYKSPPPKVVHIRYGNIRIKKFYELIRNVWDTIENEIKDHKPVNVFVDRIESIS